MKTVSGTILSSHPVKLSRAAESLSKFVLADNGASSANVNYLIRAKDSFNELVQLHKELKGKDSGRKSGKRSSSGKGSDVRPVESVAYSEKNVGLGHNRMNGRTSSDRKSRAGVNGSMDGERIAKSEEVEDEGFKEECVKKETSVMQMEVQSPDVKIEENGSEMNSGEKVKKEKKKKHVKREERSKSSVDLSNLEHGRDRHRIESVGKQEVAKTVEVTKETEADERSSKRGDSANYQVHETSDGITPAEKKKHKRKHSDQGEANEDDSQKLKKKGSKKRKSEELVDGVSDGAEHQQPLKKKKVKQEQ